MKKTWEVIPTRKINSTEMSSYQHSRVTLIWIQEPTFSQDPGVKQDSMLVKILFTLDQINWQIRKRNYSAEVREAFKAIS